jgi:hypothetical protein
MAAGVLSIVHESQKAVCGKNAGSQDESISGMMETCHVRNLPVIVRIRTETVRKT